MSVSSKYLHFTCLHSCAGFHVSKALIRTTDELPVDSSRKCWKISCKHQTTSRNVSFLIIFKYNRWTFKWLVLWLLNSRRKWDRKKKPMSDSTWGTTIFFFSSLLVFSICHFDYHFEKKKYCIFAFFSFIFMFLLRSLSLILSFTIIQENMTRPSHYLLFFF